MKLSAWMDWQLAEDNEVLIDQVCGLDLVPALGSKGAPRDEKPAAEKAPTPNAADREVPGA
jgi:hypothetical protein